MRRASVSIPSNIAEGSRRRGEKETKQFLFIAFSSGAELETQIKLTKRLEFLDINDCTKTDELLGEVMRMLNKMIYK